MADDTRVIDTGWDALPEYTDKAGEGDTVTVSLSTAPGEWLVNTTSSVVVPMSMTEVVDALRAGKLTERSLVWRQGMQEWQCVDAVPQLKLAARLSSPAPQPQPQARTRPPEKPTKPQATPPTAPSARQSPLPHPGLSRRSTLPFGLPAPTQAAPVRPHVTKPILAEPDPAEDSDVLAVYARPAATISFDLSPEQPLRAPPPAPTPLPAPVRTTLVPQTLAPTTSDSSPHTPHFHPADLSVVAAADFREVKRSGKRRVLGWSMASATAASLLTFWLARSAPNAPVVAAARAPEAAVALPTTTPSPPKVAEKEQLAAAPVEPSAAPAMSVAPPSQPAVAKAAAPKVRAPRKRRPVVAAVVDSESAATEEASASPVKEPSAEPNPYDAKGDEPAAAKAPASSGSGLEQASGDLSASTDSKTPGF